MRAAVGPRVAIRVDANGAWDIDEAIAALSSLAPAGIELAEEPVHGVEALRAVRAEVDVPLAMDETAAEEGAAGSGATDAVCLKIARCGGITGVLRDAAEARIAGSAVYLASTFDGPLGIAAAVHAAAGLTAGGPLPAHGLATLDLFAEPGERLRAVRGAIRVPPSRGWGSRDRAAGRHDVVPRDDRRRRSCARRGRSPGFEVAAASSRRTRS